MISDPVHATLLTNVGRVAGVKTVFLTPERDGLDTVYVQLDALAAHLPDEYLSDVEDALYNAVVQTIAETRRPLAWCGVGLLAPEQDTRARPLVMPMAGRA